MKSLVLLSPITLVALLLFSCDREKSTNPPPSATAVDQSATADMPILPVKTGDSWIYDVSLEIPAGVSTTNAAEVKSKHQRTRTYLGKIAAAENLPETDCFEVTTPGYPSEREFVDIRNDCVLMRGSMTLHPQGSKPLWLKTPVPFVIAGMKAGTALPEIKSESAKMSRKIQVIARETITVPGGNYATIRILTTGNDGDIELRNTVWFSPGYGIVRQEKTRYSREKLLYREIQELREHKSAAAPR